MDISAANNTRNQYFHYALIIVVCFFIFFVNNRVIPADLMEARNLATAQEMVRDGNYLTPTMNGELRLAKPPLPTWIAAEVEYIIPGSLVAQRSVTGGVAVLMVFFLYFLVSRLTGNRNTGLVACLVLATCLNIVLMGRTATWDIYCHSFMLGAIYFLVLALEKRGKQWGYFLLSGLFMGLSFLSKGPVSFYALFLPFIISYAATYRLRLRGKVMPLVAMIIVCVVVSAWWMTYIYVFHKDIGLNVAHKESSSWLNYNVRPWYYYWQFPAEAGVWALFLVTAIVYFFICKKQKLWREYKFSMIWFIASLVLLSVIPEKKPRYLLPILIPGAMLIGFYIYYSARKLSSKSEKFIFRVNGVVIAMITIALPVALYVMFYRENQISLFILIIATLFSWALSIYILRSLFGRQGIRVMNVFTAMILSMIMVTTICFIPIGHIFLNPERHSIRMLRDIKEVQGLPFFYNRDEELRMELVYEANQTIRPIDISSDSAVYSHLPFVILSGTSVDSVFIHKNVIIEKIGTFDNNWRKSDHKRYNRNLVREVAIVRAKE